MTFADREAEALIASALRRLRPGTAVIGEEAASADPGLLATLQGRHAVWLIDPLDGAANFIAGSANFAVMVALVEGGETTRAWIWQPLAKAA